MQALQECIINAKAKHRKAKMNRLMFRCSSLAKTREDHKLGELQSQFTGCDQILTVSNNHYNPCKEEQTQLLGAHKTRFLWIDVADHYLAGIRLRLVMKDINQRSICAMLFIGVYNGFAVHRELMTDARTGQVMDKTKRNEMRAFTRKLATVFLNGEFLSRMDAPAS